jgi:hypothetical protein
MAAVEELKAAIAAAFANVRALEAAQAEEIKAVKDKHSDGIWAAKKALGQAELALKEAVSNAASHPWEGKKVYRSIPIYASKWSSKQTGTKRVYGVVEVFRLGTVFADNTSSWSRPSLGNAFVRLLKKDGTPGVKIDRDRGYGGQIANCWHLAEEETEAA